MNGLTTTAAVAWTIGQRSGRSRARASRKATRVDQKYASDSGISTPVKASEGIAALAIAAR